MGRGEESGLDHGALFAAYEHLGAFRQRAVGQGVEGFGVVQVVMAAVAFGLTPVERDEGVSRPRAPVELAQRDPLPGHLGGGLAVAAAEVIESLGADAGAQDLVHLSGQPDDTLALGGDRNEPCRPQHAGVVAAAHVGHQDLGHAQCLGAADQFIEGVAGGGGAGRVVRGPAAHQGGAREHRGVQGGERARALVQSGQGAHRVRGPQGGGQHMLKCVDIC
ncbi:hypothetical protein [Streptomyces rhizosphaericus]|uniref:hypothetical protein n=1 Tax=Streptomyces rhizosphaericus TaxID=114699 RepID=UPI00363958A4